MSSKTVLMVLISEYADWEPALLAAGLRRGFGLWTTDFEVKTVAADQEPVTSVGGFRVIPDYSFDTVPEDFAALILIGGTNWFGAEARLVPPLVRRALAQNAVLGGICDASVFLGAQGFLNEAHHTSNDLETLKAKAGSAYTGAAKYHRDQPSVRDGHLVTANGAGFVEFARDVFSALNVAPAEKIDQFHKIVKAGFF